MIELGGTHDASSIALPVANFNSNPFDYVARQKIQAQHINWFIVEQLPVVPPAAYGRGFGDRTAADIVRTSVLELSYTAHDVAPFACDLDHVMRTVRCCRRSHGMDEEWRLRLRARLDAMLFNRRSPGGAIGDPRPTQPLHRVVAMNKRDDDVARARFVGAA